MGGTLFGADAGVTTVRSRLSPIQGEDEVLGDVWEALNAARVGTAKMPNRLRVRRFFGLPILPGNPVIQVRSSTGNIQQKIEECGFDFVDDSLLEVAFKDHPMIIKHDSPLYGDFEIKLFPICCSSSTSSIFEMMEKDTPDSLDPTRVWVPARIEHGLAFANWFRSFVWSEPIVCLGSRAIEMGIRKVLRLRNTPTPEGIHRSAELEKDDGFMEQTSTFLGVRPTVPTNKKAA